MCENNILNSNLLGKLLFFRLTKNFHHLPFQLLCRKGGMTLKFKTKHRVILASGSPRRKELLELLGIQFEVEVSNFHEDEVSLELDRAVYARTLAYNKAYAVAKQNPDAVVIGA